MAVRNPGRVLAAALIGDRRELFEAGTRTQRGRQTDCGWQNLEAAANNFHAFGEFAGTKVPYMERAPQSQTSGTQDALSPFARMMSRLVTPIATQL